MADEIELNATLSYSDEDGTNDFLQVLNLFVDVASKGTLKFTAQVPITEIALVAGGISGFGWMMMINRDAANFVSVLDGSGGDEIGRMYPGEPYGPIRRGVDLTNPFLIADTATCKVDVLMILT